MQAGRHVRPPPATFSHLGNPPHSRVSLSSLPVASQEPSGAIATAFTMPAWLVMVAGDGGLRAVGCDHLRVHRARVADEGGFLGPAGDVLDLRCPDYYASRIDPDRRRRNHVRQLEALGYTVILERAG
jgi:hypothetical protein